MQEITITTGATIDFGIYNLQDNSSELDLLEVCYTNFFDPYEYSASQLASKQRYLWINPQTLASVNGYELKLLESIDEQLS